MDSEESRPGSSASNSSSNSSDNSRNSYQIQENNEENVKFMEEENAEGSKNNIERSSRSRSRFSSDRVGSTRSESKSDSDSSSSTSSSDNEQDDIKSTGENGEIIVERHLLGSPVKSVASSRNSSVFSNRSQSNSRENRAIDDNTNISSDLSDVSDLESDKQMPFDKSRQTGATEENVNDSLVLKNENCIEKGLEDNRDDKITDLRQKLDLKKNQVKNKDRDQENMDDRVNSVQNEIDRSGESLVDLVKAHDEDALDFEAEEGECQEIINKEDEKKGTDDVEKDLKKKTKCNSEKSDGEAEEGEELEEGEVSDEDEKRPEETEPKPVCRFYTRGQCTWGMSCRFLHPGVTDKGNYTMFDLVRPISVPQTGASSSRPAAYSGHLTDYHDYRTERPILHHRTAPHHSASMFPVHHEARSALPAEAPVVVESAWERGLRTAKEMMRKANKRKEQDMDFEDKKMNLTLSPDEMEKEAYYLKDRGSPLDNVPLPYGRYGHAMYQDLPSGMHSSPDRFSRANGPILPFEEVDSYGRSTRYRELPPHRMPQYEDERRVRPTREVIVQRVEPAGRGDEWNDPWMRSKSPGGRGSSRDRADKRRRDRHSYSSNSSYSSSSSSQSDSSSDSSHSPSPVDHRRRYNNSSHKSPPPNRRHGIRSVRSPSSPPRRSRHSPGVRHSPNIKKRGHQSSSPVIDKRAAYSPSHTRKKSSPVLKKTYGEQAKLKRHRASSSSGSGSSDSSGSDSDSDSGSSSSDSSSQSRGHTSLKRIHGSKRVLTDRKLAKKVEPPKKRSPISIELKKPTTVGTSALASSPTHSISSEKDNKKSRREELLKQLRAVEDAIAKKRSKLA